MRLLMSVTSVLLLAVAANGCSDSIGPKTIVGTWEQDNTVPGSGLAISLALDGSTVSGPGTWCGELLGCGSTSTTGTVTGNKVHLVTTFDDGRIEIFDGTLTSSHSLAGSVRTPQMAMPYVQSFHRAADDPPRTQ